VSPVILAPPALAGHASSLPLFTVPGLLLLALLTLVVLAYLAVRGGDS
jgi:hypothetical protein